MLLAENKSIGAVLCTVERIADARSTFGPPHGNMCRMTTSFVIDIDKAMALTTSRPPVGIIVQLDDNRTIRPHPKFGVLQEERILTLYREILTMLSDESPPSMGLRTDTESSSPLVAVSPNTLNIWLGTAA